MRPIAKGAAPQVFTKYVDARDHLIARIGDYCCYCERHCDPHVEHIEPQGKYPNRSLDWLNFLLACSYCNGIKTDTFAGTSAYYFPDDANTAYLFIYDEANNEVCVNGAITNTAIVTTGQGTVDLVGLNRRLDSRNRPDRRWQKRLEAWRIAQRAHTRHCANPPIDAKDIESIRELALQTGFFSIWLTVFANVPAVCVDLIQSFPGVRTACYDGGTGLPVPDITL